MLGRLRVTTNLKASGTTLNRGSGEGGLLKGISHFFKKEQIKPCSRDVFFPEVSQLLLSPIVGIIIDNNLSWKHPIDHAAIKMSRTVGLICKLRHFLPRHTLLTIYRSLVAPYLTYGLTAWGQAYKSHLEKLLKQIGRASCRERV